MNLTAEQITVLVTVLVGLAVALTNYLNSRSTRTEVKKLREHVETVTRTPMVDGHNQLPPPRG